MTADILIAIVEDDPDISSLLQATLESNGYITRAFSTAQDFRDAVDELQPKVNLIDLGLPDQDGMTLVRELSYNPNSSTIIITGRRDLSDKIICLELGADDYVIKPFEPREVVARVRSVLRRIDKSQQLEEGKNLASFAGYTMNFNTYELCTSCGECCNLSRGEAHILKAFLSAPNRLLSREDLMGLIHIDHDKNYDRSIDVRISRLRNKIEENPKKPQFIKTVYGAGYLFVGKVEWSQQ